MKHISLTIWCTIFLGAMVFGQATETFSSSGTWTAPCGITSVVVQAWGAGGKGGSSTSQRGGGGGGGGAFSKKVVTVTPGTTYRITVDVSGGQGQTLFSLGSTNLVIANSGKNGENNNGSGGAGGAASPIAFADESYMGGNGANGLASGGGGGGGGAGTNNNGGNAGSPLVVSFGSGGQTGGGNGGSGQSNNGVGSNGTAPGGGGGGGRSNNNTVRNGGDGGAGRLTLSYITYCTINFISAREPITLVQFAGINNTTSNTINGTPALESFCHISGNVVAGEKYNIKLKGNTDGNYTNYFSVFIDWNQDGIFGNDERVNIGSIFQSTGNDSKELNGIIDVPEDAVLGTTRMRVIKNYNSYITDACTNGAYGQAEDYSLIVTGGCKQPTAATANGSSTALSICNNTAITLKQTGGALGPGQTWKWYSGNCGGTLLNSNTNADASFTFTPAVGVQTYFVRAEGATCGTTGSCASITVTVKNNGSIAPTVSGGENFGVCRTAAAQTHATFIIGGGSTDVTVTGLPAGLSGSLTGATYSISGTTTASIGTYNYTVTVDKNGPCAPVTFTGTITVNAAPTNIVYTTATYCTGSAITPNAPTITGGLPTAYSISPSLPAGLSMNPATGIISGTPTAAIPQTTYSITGTNSCGVFTTSVKITILAGKAVFDMTPGGTINSCTPFGGTVMGLSGSEIGVNYQLYLGGAPIGASVAGTGNAISFGNQTSLGTYTIRSLGSCVANMNGSTIINVTNQPTTTFTYPSYNNCTMGSISPTMSGAPTTGSFSAMPAGLIIDPTTGKVDLYASAPGSYTISYRVAASGGCSIYTYTNPNPFVVEALPTIYDVSGGGNFCVIGPGIKINLSGSQIGYNYQLYRNGTPMVPAQILAGTGAALSFNNQILTGNYTVFASKGSGSACTQVMNGSASVNILPTPSPIIVTPSSANVCEGSIIPLSASFRPQVSSNGFIEMSSGSINMAIPDNNAVGVSNLIKLGGIPYGAIVTNVTITFNITHPNDGDLILNLKGANGKILNIANGIGGSGANFTNTRISFTATNSITNGSAPFNNLYSPQASQSVIGASIVPYNVSNASTLFDLFESSGSGPNGNWELSVRDRTTRNSGTFLNWQIRVDYRYVSNSVSVKWASNRSNLDLYTDPGATIPYNPEDSAVTVFAKPSQSGQVEYYATAYNSAGCFTEAQAVVLNVNPSPQLTMAADYCNYPGKVRITATADMNVSGWSWKPTGSSGTTLSPTVNYIEPNGAGVYYVTAKSAANNCTTRGEMSIAQELVINGSFEDGDQGFVTGYVSVSENTRNGLVPEGTYSVTSTPNYSHSNFWGIDHTTNDGYGKFMLVNGVGGNKVIWQQTVTVIPNTDYYFSAYAVSLNSVEPFANLQFKVNNVNAGSPTGVLAPKAQGTNDPGPWKQFLGNWNSGNSTSAVIEIVDLETAAGGNDFGLDDISFGTLSTFVNLISPAATANQSGICVGTPITEVVFEVGGDGKPPIIGGSVPPGIITFWNGRNLYFRGTPTQGGTFNFTVTNSGCNPKTKSAVIKIDALSKTGTYQNIYSACTNNGGTITMASGTRVGDVTEWQSSDDGINWNDEPFFPKNGNFNYQPLSQPKYFRNIVKNGTCGSDTSKIIKVGIKNLWEGKVSNEFSGTANWSDEVVPLAGSSNSSCPTVLIPEVPSGNFYPVISMDNPEIINLQISQNASLTISGNGMLSLSGTLTNYGTIDAVNGALEFNGNASTPQVLSGKGFVDNTIQTLVVSNRNTTSGLSISNAVGEGVKVSKLLLFGTNTSILNTMDNLTLGSNHIQTASVGTMASGNRITGKVTVERYLPVKQKAWHMLTSPTVGSTIKESWMENSQTVDVNSLANPNKGYGININGEMADWQAKGFDAPKATMPSMKYFDITTQTYIGVPHTNMLIRSQSGYFIFVRGDRSIVRSNQAPVPVTLRTKGTLYQPSAMPPALSIPANKWMIVGNPYASSIKYQALNTTNLQMSYTIWDPNGGGEFGTGIFRTIQGNTVVPQGGNYTNGNIPDIQSGQAFFVQASNTGTGNVAFSENAKVIGSSNDSYFAPISHNLVSRVNAAESKLVVNLWSVSGQNSFIADGVLSRFGEQYSNEWNIWDAEKLANNTENFGIASKNKILAIESRKFPESKDTLRYNFTQSKVQSYKLEFLAEALELTGQQFYFHDAYLGTVQLIPADGEFIYDFKIENNTASKAANRFYITYKPLASSLPVTFIAVNARERNGSIDVDWKVGTEENVKLYEVEKSMNGVSFTKSASVNATGNKVYQWTDINSSFGWNYYRIKSVDLDGKLGYSSVVKAYVQHLPGSISVNPNPIVDGKINLALKNQSEGSYWIRLIDGAGKVLINKKIDHSAGTNNYLINPDFKIAKGFYHLEVTKPDESSTILKVIY